MNRVGTPLSDSAAEPAWVGEVLRYWFEELTETLWFNASRAVDDQIHERFLELHDELAAGRILAVTTPRGLLSAVIVLDQFSRNLFRGTPRAYAADPLARRLASTAINQGYDRDMTIPQKQFFYLPFQHSEDPQDQVRSLALFEKLGNESWTRYALAHKSIIDRFGRFPHRNEILGRQSSAEELAALEEPMGSF
jgi:uncharacterized protein (DUF924 family)